MHEITDLVKHYRSVARAVWNLGYWPDPELRNWDARDQFLQIKNLLFKSLVAARVEEGHCCDLATLPNYVYQVIPCADGIPILIHKPRPGTPNRYWDDPVNSVNAADVELHFVDFFDWDALGCNDFRYYLVRIAAFPSQPHLVGREALLEHDHAKVFHIPARS